MATDREGSFFLMKADRAVCVDQLCCYEEKNYHPFKPISGPQRDNQKAPYAVLRIRDPESGI
jgi:hypothetical protein